MFPTPNYVCEHFAIATNVTESSMNAGRDLQTPLGTFAIWKKWPTLWIRGAFLL